MIAFPLPLAILLNIVGMLGPILPKVARVLLLPLALRHLLVLAVIFVPGQLLPLPGTLARPLTFWLAAITLVSYRWMGFESLFAIQTALFQITSAFGLFKL